MTGSVENRKSEGVMVTFERITAISNMPAGAMVALQTVTGRRDCVMSLGATPLGLSATAQMMGYHFAGILDDNISAGGGSTSYQSVNVWTKGVFRFRVASAITTASVYIGAPCWVADSGSDMVGTPGETGEPPIGSFVSRPLENITANQFSANAWIDVKINPAVWRWTKLFVMTTVTATQACGLCFPPIAQP